MAYWRVGGGNPVYETANCRLHIMKIFRNKFKEELRDKSANIYFGELPHQTHFILFPSWNKQRGLPQPITTLIPCSISCSGHNKLHLLACVWISRLEVATCCKVNCRASAIICWEYSSLWQLFCYSLAVHCRHEDNLMKQSQSFKVDNYLHICIYV